MTFLIERRRERPLDEAACAAMALVVGVVPRTEHCDFGKRRTCL